MSHKADIARAESGRLFRNSHLVPAEDIPGTKANIARLERVDKAIKEAKLKKEVRT